MHLVLLSGGSGKRLWPLSNGVRSKQFLKLLRSDDGSSESMVQRICRQFTGQSSDLHWSSVTVVAGKAQSDQLMMQLGSNVNILIEPERRDTFPAISYALAWLHSNGVGKDESVAVMPVDPFVEASFFNRIALIDKELENTGADIVLLGSRPQFPTEKFGYILVDKESKESKESNLISFPVQGFREKPRMKDAQELMNEGALWNCGVFGMKLGYVLDILKSKHQIEQFDINYMTNAFTTLAKTSFDYEVVETAKNIRVIEYDDSWKDLGTWESLTEEIGESSIGNVITDSSSVRSHIINELDIPIVAMGIKDMVVVASLDGILVSAKEETYRLKETMSTHDARPMHEKKRWGEYFALNHTKSDSGDTLTKKLIIEAGKQLSYQVHQQRDEVWTIAHGDGILFLNDQKSVVSAGQTISIKAGDKHGIYAVTNLEIIEIQFGFPLIEEDIVRIQQEWNPEN